MALRCFLFSSDEGTANIIRQVLTGLGVEGESCSEADVSSEKLAKESFQLVVVDWDQQPEAAALLATTRGRKASERPLTLAIVSDEAHVPKALQAGANSILRRPLLLNQVKDTLATARDLMRARVESAANAAQTLAAAAAAGAASTASPREEFAVVESADDKSLRAGDFLSAASVASSGQVETDSEVFSPEQSAAANVDPLKDLETVAEAAPVAPPPERPRSLEELLRSRGVTRQSDPPQAPPSAEGGKPELLGFDQSASRRASQAENRANQQEQQAHEQKQEAQLFAYIAGESQGQDHKSETSPSRFRLAKGPIIAASILAAAAVVLAPQAPWHPAVQALWSREQKALHAWLNPQPVTTPSAPAAHEDFGRAGDEYKLPVAENIPDATTDPSQIRVEPVVDPTAKKTTVDGAAPDPNAAQPAGPANGQTVAPANTPADAAQAAPAQVPQGQPIPGQPSPNQPLQSAPAATQIAAGSTAAGSASVGSTGVGSTAAGSTGVGSTAASSAGVGPPAVGAATPATQPAVAPSAAPAAQTSNPPAVVYSPVTTNAAPPKAQPATHVPATYVPPTTKVPSSLQSQMASMVPDASGNKSPDSAMQAIEPVEVPELTERALLADQIPLDVPASAGGKEGTVILQVLVGRDGAVQDAKFVQGSLAFARAAIDGVKQWKFKPYVMNGRPVSVATRLTIKFPAQ